MRVFPKLDDLGSWPAWRMPRWAESTPEAKRDPQPRKPRWLKRKWLIGAIALVMVAAVIVLRPSSAPAGYTTEPVKRGDVTQVTTASGLVNPVETVQIGSYVSGRIAELYCDYNTKVTKGQRCAKIDARSYEASVEQAAAALATAKAQLAKDQATLDYAKLSHDRAASLSSRDVVSQDAAQKALSGYKQSQAQLAVDQASIQQREAELKVARVNLDYTDIISPVDGTVVSRNVAIGQTVAASFQTPTLFVVATDLTHMQIDANVTEAAIGGVHEGQKAAFTVAAFPDRTFSGVVTQVREAPISVQNVISYDVVISADNPDRLLKPGMTATARISVAERNNVMRVPESAVRFMPAGIASERATRLGDKKQKVWAVRNGGLVAVPVTVGLTGEHYIEVTGGLAAGERIATGRKRSGDRAAAQVASQR